jgi:hypothetical protein
MQIYIFGLPTEILGIWGLLIYRYKGLENTFQWCITCPRNFKIAVVKPKKKINNRLVTVDQGGQKNCNGKIILQSWLIKAHGGIACA